MRWSVTRQVPTVQPGPGTTTTPGYMVHVETDGGHQDQVFVPKSEYTPEGVTQRVNDHLAKVAAVADLQGNIPTRGI